MPNHLHFIRNFERKIYKPFSFVKQISYHATINFYWRHRNNHVIQAKLVTTDKIRLFHSMTKIKNKFPNDWNPDINSIASTIASGSELLFKLFENYKEALYALQIIHIPDIDQWLSFYLNHKTINKKMFEISIRSIDTGNGPIKAPWLQIKRILKALSIPMPLFVEQINFLSKHEKKELLSCINSHTCNESSTIISQIEKPIAPPMTKKDLLKCSEFTFFMRVWFPCWLEYGTYPTILFRKARQGDLDSICMLLRIDNAITRDKRIEGHIHQASLIPNSDSYKKITNSMNKPIRVPSVKKMKLRIASMISQYAKQFEITHTAPQLQKLFDEVAHQKNNDNINDIDLEMTPEAFYMYLRRQPIKWQVTLDRPMPVKPNKK